MGQRFFVYAVAEGRIPGLYYKWSEAEAQVKNHPRFNVKGFDTVEEACRWLEQNRGTPQKNASKNESKCGAEQPEKCREILQETASRNERKNQSKRKAQKPRPRYFAPSSPQTPTRTTRDDAIEISSDSDDASDAVEEAKGAESDETSENGDSDVSDRASEADGSKEENRGESQDESQDKYSIWVWDPRPVKRERSPVDQVGSSSKAVAISTGGGKRVRKGVPDIPPIPQPRSALQTGRRTAVPSSVSRPPQQETARQTRGQQAATS